MNADVPAVPVADPAKADTPAQEGMSVMIPARGFGPGPVPLGLDRPLQLRGGHALDPVSLVGGLRLDWQPVVTAFVAHACRRQTGAGQPWLWMPPVALLGPTGAGRMHTARSIARYAGLPFVHVDIARRPAGGRPLEAADERRHGLPLPTVPVLAMAATGCANPVVFVTGIDEADEGTLGQLAAMIDPISAERWVEQSIRATVDLAQVNWIIAAADDLRFPPALGAAVARLAVSMPPYGSLARLVLTASVLAELMADLGLVADDLRGGPAAVVEIVETAFPANVYDRTVSGLHARLSDELTRRRRP